MLELVLTPVMLVISEGRAILPRREGGRNVDCLITWSRTLPNNGKKDDLGLTRRRNLTQEEIYLYIHITKKQVQAHQCTDDACHIINR
jgi:hypothetical protein